MEALKLELTLDSGEDLLDVRRDKPWLKMKVYAQVSINRDPKRTFITPVDYVRGRNPKWDTRIPFVLSQESVKGADTVFIRLLCERTFQPPKYVGEVELPLKELFEKKSAAGNDPIDPPAWEEHKVSRANQKGEFGVVRFSYCFYEQVIEADESCSDSNSSGGGWKKLLLPVVVCAAAEMIAAGSSTIITKLFEDD